ncbi:uncharacterized protein LOC134840645 [Symsagittifera roscoffensis]|uniref:uncharacterized protein LOC134840645 n=1 Tax=Symsagittifera roscoffensis TaxID=84072 RepID=UPI00307B8BBF
MAHVIVSSNVLNFITKYQVIFARFRTPLISFPDRLRAKVASSPTSNLAKTSAKLVSPSSSTSVNPLDRKVLASQFASTDQEKMDFARLPQRFRRKQALEWEMEAINVGGE